MHLGNLALSGAGMLVIEATGVEPEGRITPACLGLWSDANEAALVRVVEGIRKYSDRRRGHLGHWAGPVVTLAAVRWFVQAGTSETPLRSSGTRQ